MVEDEVVVDVLQAAVEHHCMQALMSSVIRSKQNHGASARAAGSSSVNNGDGAGTCPVPVLRFVVEGFPRTAGQVALWVNTGYSIDRALIQGTTAGRNPNPIMEGLVPASLKGVLLTPEERALGNAAAALQALGVADVVTRGWDSAITSSALTRAVTTAPSCLVSSAGLACALSLIKTSGSKLSRTWWSP